MFFTLTNRALYPVMYVVTSPVHGIQDRTRSEDENKNKTKNKGTMTQSTCQKTIEEGHCKEVQMNMSHHGNSPLLKSI